MAKHTIHTLAPETRSRAAARIGYELEWIGMLFLSKEEQEWLQRRRVFCNKVWGKAQ